MGRASRSKPKRLAEKLLQIRLSLGLSQNSLINRLELVDELTQDYISGFERNVREPSLNALLQYARIANVWLDVLVDDELNLPDKLPASASQKAGVRRKVK